jgi:predicted nicotinamide N-methyase
MQHSSLQSFLGRFKSLQPLSGRRVYPSRREELLAILESVGPFRVDPVPLPGTNTTLQITHTADLDRLLGIAIFDPDQEFMPYWTEIWPAGVILGGAILREADLFQGQRVLELGPGVGVTAVAAMHAGAELTVIDYAPGSLALTALNALDQVGTEPRTLLVNWRNPTREFRAAIGDGFAMVIAADVLYEDEDVKPLADLLERILAPGGEVWIAEPGRDAAEKLLKLLRRRGWGGETEECASSRPDPNYSTFDVVKIHRLRRARRKGARSRGAV